MSTRRGNRKFCKELIAYFPFIRHPRHRKQRVQQFFCCCMCIRCRWNVFTEPLPNNGKGDKHRARWSHKPTFILYKSKGRTRLRHVRLRYERDDILFLETGAGQELNPWCWRASYYTPPPFLLISFSFATFFLVTYKLNKKDLRGLSPQANYTHRATAASR
jgi:hypothetical protein